MHLIVRSLNCKIFFFENIHRSPRSIGRAYKGGLQGQPWPRREIWCSRRFPASRLKFTFKYFSNNYLDKCGDCICNNPTATFLAWTWTTRLCGERFDQVSALLLDQGLALQLQVDLGKQVIIIIKETLSKAVRMITVVLCISARGWLVGKPTRRVAPRVFAT